MKIQKIGDILTGQTSIKRCWYVDTLDRTTGEIALLRRDGGWRIDVSDAATDCPKFVTDVFAIIAKRLKK